MRAVTNGGRNEQWMMGQTKDKMCHHPDESVELDDGQWAVVTITDGRWQKYDMCSNNTDLISYSLPVWLVFVVPVWLVFAVPVWLVCVVPVCLVWLVCVVPVCLVFVVPGWLVLWFCGSCLVGLRGSMVPARLVFVFFFLRRTSFNTPALTPFTQVRNEIS